MPTNSCGHKPTVKVVSLKVANDLDTDDKGILSLHLCSSCITRLKDFFAAAAAAPEDVIEEAGLPEKGTEVPAEFLEG